MCLDFVVKASRLRYHEGKKERDAMSGKYDFTTCVNRTDTGSVKWEQMREWNPEVSDGVIPLSVADMEFKNPPEVVKGLKDYLDEAVLGYAMAYPAFLQAVASWQERRHGWQIQPEWIVNSAGVVTAFYAAIRALTEEGDGVIIFRPVYYPFGMAITDTGRTEINVPLRNEAGYYTIDFAAFEEVAADPRNKVLLFCSPHNPVGRVWTREELERIASIVQKHDLYVISDEVWYDLVMPGYRHTVLATVDASLQDRVITCTAPSKTFNLAGMMTSNIIIADEELRERFRKALQELHGDRVGILGYKACELAYTRSEDWLEELLGVLDTNQRLVHDFFRSHFPQLTAPLVEGTYVQWVDFRALGWSDAELEEFLHQEAHFFTDEGYVFGVEGSGFERINLALPTDALAEALERLKQALERRGIAAGKRE